MLYVKEQSGKRFKIITIPSQFPKDVIKTKKKIIIGFDPKLHNQQQFNSFLKVKNVNFKKINKNLIDQVWPKN